MTSEHLTPKDKDFANKLVAALRVGLKEMAEKAAANNESLVIGHKDGSVETIPATELLKKLSK